MRLNIQLFAVTKSTTFAESAISIENNTSTLKITIKFSPNNNVTYFSSKTLNCTCNGVKKSASVSLSKGGSVTKSFTFTGIKHNADGTKSVSWSWSCATGTSVLGTISDSGTKTLTTIQRYGKITNISGAITDSTITIDWHSYNANWVYDLEIEGYYTYRNIGSSVGDHTININVGNDYFNNSSTEVILPITYYLVTYPSDESWSYLNPLYTMIQLNEEAKPTISIGTITEADTTMQGLNWGVFVQNKSKLNIWTTSSGNTGSYVRKVVLTTRESNLSYSPSTDVTSLGHAFITPYVLGTSGTNTITAVSTDSRSRSSTTATTTLNVVAYSNPTITTATVQRCNQDKSLNDNGTYLLINFVGSISPVSNHNDKEFRIGYKKTTESSYTYVTLSSTYSVNLTNELSSFQVDPDYSYNIVFEAEDTFTTTKIDRLVEVGSDLINFNTNGKALAIGKVSEAGANEEKFEVAVPTTFTETLRSVKGFFSYGTGNVGTPTGGSNLVIKRASSGETPNNGVVLEFGNSTSWVGQLYIGDNADQGVYYNGWSNGVRGTWKKLAWDSDVYKIVSLYDNASGSNASISLSETSANFTYIEIFYRTNDNYRSSKKIYNPNGKKVLLDASQMSGNYTYVKSAQYSISGTNITLESGLSGQARIGNNVATTWNKDSNRLYIEKVIGYR